MRSTELSVLDYTCYVMEFQSVKKTVKFTRNMKHIFTKLYMPATATG